MSEDALATYLAEVERFTPFELADEQRLARWASGGDAESRDRLAQTYLARVARLAIELAPSRIGALEAIQEANILLVRAIDEGLCAPTLEPELRARIQAAFEQLRN